MNTSTDGKKNNSANPSKVGSKDSKDVSKVEVSDAVQMQIDVLTTASVSAKHKTGVMLQNYLSNPSSIPTLDTIGLVMSQVRGLDAQVIKATLAIVRLHSKGVLFQLVDKLKGDEEIKPEVLVNRLVNTVKKEMAIAPLLKYLGWTRTDLILDMKEENDKLLNDNDDLIHGLDNLDAKNKELINRVAELEKELQKAKTLESKMK